MYNILRQKDKLEEKLISFQVLVYFKVDFSFNTVIIENSFRSVSFCTAAACMENFKASRKSNCVYSSTSQITRELISFGLFGLSCLGHRAGGASYFLSARRVDSSPE